VLRKKKISDQVNVYAHREGKEWKYQRYQKSKKVIGKRRRKKAQYPNKLENQFSTSNTHAVWRDLQQITQYKHKPIPANNDLILPDQLNRFYSRFDRTSTTNVSNHYIYTPCSRTP